MLNAPAPVADTRPPAVSADRLPLRRPIRVAAPSGLRTLVSGTRLFAEGDPVGPIEEVIDGALMLSRTGRDGHRQIIDIVGPGRLVGLGAGGVHLADADALTRTRLRPLDPARAETLVAREIETAYGRLYDHTVLLGRKSARERVAAGLLELVGMFGLRPFGGAPATTFVLPLSRSELADWLGLVIETVSRTLTSLQRDGVILIERTDTIHVIDPAALRAASAAQPGRRPRAA